MEKNKFIVKIEKNSIKDLGEGKVRFSKPVTITDGSEQWNGTRYDIASIKLDNFNQKLTADHSSSIEKVLGLVEGIRKVGNKRVTIDGINFAVKQNPLSLYAYNMMTAKDGPYLTDFSTETTGTWPDDEGVYRDASIVGLSLVVTGNNKSARVNEIVRNSIEQARENGLDTSELESNFYKPLDTEENNLHNDSRDMKFVTITNSRKFAVTVTFKNATGDEVAKTLQANETVDVSEDQKDLVQNQINDAEEVKEDTKEEEKEGTSENKLVLDALNSLTDKFNKLEEKVFNDKAKEPQFTTNKTNKIENMGWRERYNEQMKYAWNAFRNNDSSAMVKFQEFNKVNLEGLKEAKLVENSMTIADMGNFVIPPEMLRDIKGYRSNYRPLLDAVTYRDTLSLQFSYITRDGDIDMQPVEACDDGEDGNLKPISEYEAGVELSNMEELAAVTPICTAATRFLAVDLLGDVAAGYRNDYDRKLAQLVIARFQQAVDSTGNSVLFDPTTGISALSGWIDTVAEISEEVENGVFVMSNASRWVMIKQAIKSGISGNILEILKSGDMSPILGAPAIVVPNNLLPKLGTSDTRSFLVGGSTVTVDQAIFYGDMSAFTGRTSGGLQYDLSAHASYEVATQEGVKTRSAWQRNEIVARGSFWRGGVVTDPTRISGLSDHTQS